MFHALSRFDASGAQALREALEAHLRGVPKVPRGDGDLVFGMEEAVRRDPSACFAFDADGQATLTAKGRSFRAGRFETASIGELRERALRARARTARGSPALRLHVIDGASAGTDIGALQALAPPGSLFQVASQFNCLESPLPRIVPVFDYFEDPTQGPRASISAFPGTLLRHYAAPADDGTRFVQRDPGPQINLLASACSPDIAAVQCGYLTPDAIRKPGLFARILEDRFDDIRVGVHDGIDVVFGHDWLGPVSTEERPRIAQVLTSTLAAGLYGHVRGSDPDMLVIIRQLQRAAYAGTLLAAASLGKSSVVLTLIGGGVFGNPVAVVWESILWAADLVAPLLQGDLCIIVNGYSLSGRISARELCEGAQARGGTLSIFEEDSIEVFAAPDSDRPVPTPPVPKR
jgi:hypothetical protein